MNYDFSLIQISPHPEDGSTVVNFEKLFEAHKELEASPFPEAFDKELERLSAMPFSDDVAAKIREVAKKGFTKAAQGETIYFAVHSMVRSRFNRTQRAQAATHARFKQHVGSDQRRLLRNRPMLLSESDLTRDRNELLEQQRAGLLEVRTLDGRLVDLETLQIAPALPAENPRPSPILDSLANDIPAGIPFPKLPGGAILSPNQVQQVVEGMASIDGELQVDPKDGSALVVPAGSQEAPLPEGLLEEPFEPALENPENEELALDEEELEELPPGVPPPPAPAGGMPPRPQHGGNKNKHKNRR